MAKRGSIPIYVAMLVLFPAFAAGDLSNYTTSGNGYLLIDAPATAPVGMNFSLNVRYFVLNQLLTSINVSVAKAGKVIDEYLLYPDQGNLEKAFRLREDRKGTALYTLGIVERNVNSREYTTKITIPVQVVSRGFDAAFKDLFKGIVVDSNETLSDDLSRYEPYEYAGTLSYLIMKKNMNEVDCQLEGKTIYFTPARGFQGNASCQVRAYNEKDNATYVYHILVGTADEVVRFNQDIGVAKPEVEVEQYDAGDELEAAIGVVQEGSLVLVMNASSIRHDAPERFDIGKEYVVTIAAIVTNPAVFIGIDTIISPSHGVNVSCNNNSTCTAQLVIKPEKAGIEEIVYAVNQVLRDPSPEEIYATQEDLIITVDNNSQDMLVWKSLLIPVGEPLKDIAVPVLGVIQDVSTPEAELTVEKILKEYQRKKRIEMNIGEEVGKIREISEHIEVTKALTRVQKINLDGFEEDHTLYTVRIKKKGSLEDFLLGTRTFKNVLVFEHIPKEAASTIGKVRLDTQGYEIIVDDPLVVWRFDDLNSPKEITYEVSTATDSQGNTFVSADVDRGFPNILFALVLIPLIALTVIYFDRFKKHPSVEIEEILDRPPDYRELEDEFYRPEVSSNVPKDEVPPEQVRSMNDFDRLLGSLEEYIIHRLKKGDRDDRIKQELLKANWPEDIIDKLVEKHVDAHKKKKR